MGITISPDGKEILFTRRLEGTKQNRIYYMKYENGYWLKPQLSPFSDGNRESEANFSPDGKTIFFNSRRPLPANITTNNQMNVWFVQKEDGVWKESKVLGPPVSDMKPMFVTQAKDGTIYFTGNIDRGIYKAEYRAGEYAQPERLPDEINGRNWAGHPFIDPDEKFILFDSNIDQEGTKNLYISFGNEQGSWSPSININKYIDFPKHAAIPHITFDGEYLFFSSEGDIYWICAKIIEDLKPKK
ncbi:MAG: hypothetical protein V3V99_12590 [candidate division Zixibacteria bacterium]